MTAKGVAVRKMATNGMTAAAVMAAVVTMSWPSDAQSLADVARREAERRGTVMESGRVYTNDNITPDFTTSPAPGTEPGEGETAAELAPELSAEAAAAALESGGATAGTPDAQADAAAAGAAPVPASELDEPYWRDRASSIRQRIAAQERQVELLRARAASLAQSTASPEQDVVQRALAKAVEDQQFLQEEWDRFERSALERGVPDAWIR